MKKPKKAFQLYGKGKIPLSIEIHSLESIEKRSADEWECSTAIISIGDNGSVPPKLAHQPDYFMRLEFEDIASDEAGERGVNPEHMFSDEQAREIAEFVYGCKNEVDLLICQCEYGQSRSAGCAAAIRQHFYGDGIEIFANEKYYPNKPVFHKLTAALCKR